MADPTPYTPPEVWQWSAESGGAFSKINRPISGATHERELPVGRHPLQLYSLGTPNGVKVTVMLEELLALGKSGAEYDAYLINISEGDQFSSGFVAVNPNSKIPALLDRSTTPPTRVFESGAILVYLAEKFDAFLPKDPSPRATGGGACVSRFAASRTGAKIVIVPPLWGGGPHAPCGEPISNLRQARQKAVQASHRARSEHNHTQASHKGEEPRAPPLAGAVSSRFAPRPRRRGARRPAPAGRGPGHYTHRTR